MVVFSADIAHHSQQQCTIDTVQTVCPKNGYYLLDTYYGNVVISLDSIWLNLSHIDLYQHAVTSARIFFAFVHTRCNSLELTRSVAQYRCCHAPYLGSLSCHSQSHSHPGPHCCVIVFLIITLSLSPHRFPHPVFTQLAGGLPLKCR